MLRLPLIVGTLPNTLANGQTADAVPLMADLNFIVNQVNANAATLANTALLNAANSFTAVQSGLAATNAANFPIASQVQNDVFHTLSSTLGTNTLTARIAALPLTAWPQGAIFTFVPAQTNTGPASITVDSAGSAIIFSAGQTLVGGELRAGSQVAVAFDTNRLNLLNPSFIRGGNSTVLGFLTSEASGTRGFSFGGLVNLAGATVQVTGALSSDQVTGTSGVVAVTPAAQVSHGSSVKAYGVVTPPTTITTSYGQSAPSVVKNAVGDYTVAPGVNFSLNQYTVLVMPQGAAGAVIVPVLVSSTRTAFRVTFADQTAAAVDPTTFSYAVFGQLT